jgi:hypothetical protein
MIGSGGLRAVKTDDLKKLLAAVYRGDLPCPIDGIGLATAGLLRLQDELGVLQGLDRKSVQVALVCALAERTR